MSADDLLNILLAIAVGGAIGIEREFRDKAAGLRTLIFICLGSALFTMFSIEMAGPAPGESDGDPTRIAANIVAGVGFIGAGVILREGGRIIGLTTAAMIWLVAALGMGIAAGQHAIVLAVTALTLLILFVFPWIEHWVDTIRDERTYEIVTTQGAAKYEALDRDFHNSGLRVLQSSRSKAGAQLTCRWKVAGARATHLRLVERLLADPGIDELRY